MMPGAETFVYWVGMLNKPIRYSFPTVYCPPLQGELRNWERESPDNIRSLDPPNRRRIADYAGLPEKATVQASEKLRK